MEESFKGEATLDFFYFSFNHQRQIIEHLKLEGNMGKSNHQKDVLLCGKGKVGAAK